MSHHLARSAPKHRLGPAPVWPAAIAHTVGATASTLIPTDALPSAAISAAYVLTHARRSLWRSAPITAHREIPQ